MLFVFVFCSLCHVKIVLNRSAHSDGPGAKTRSKKYIKHMLRGAERPPKRNPKSIEHWSEIDENGSRDAVGVWVGSWAALRRSPSLGGPPFWRFFGRSWAAQGSTSGPSENQKWLQNRPGECTSALWVSKKSPKYPHI